MMGFVRSGMAAAVALAVVTAPMAATAQTADGEETALAQCVQLSTSGKDRILTARWLMGALGSAPQLQDIVHIDQQLRQQSDVAMAALFTRLLTVDCLAEAKPIFKRDARGAGIREAFEVLGQIAVQELMGGDPNGGTMGSFANYLNEADFAALRD